MPATRDRRTRAAWGIAILALDLTSRASFARDAATSPDSDSRTAEAHAEARDRYRAGATAYAAGRYKDAIDLFLDANRLSPSAALSFDVARAYDKLGDTSGALEWYRDYLRQDEKPADADQVARRIELLEQQLAARGVQQVTVLSKPRGATVVIDGQPVGVTPWTGDLAPGTHRAGLIRKGYAEVDRDFVLATDQARAVFATLDPETTRPARSPAPTSPVAAEFVEPTPKVTSTAAGTTPPSSQEMPADSGSHRSPFTTWGWVAVGAGGAALGGALVFEILRRNAESDARHESTQIGYASEIDTMESRQTAARILVGTGAALAATGGILLVVGLGQSHETRPGVALGCLSNGCAASVSGRF